MMKFSEKLTQENLELKNLLHTSGIVFSESTGLEFEMEKPAF